MERLKRVTSRLVHLPLDDVDTDQIIPAQFLTQISSTGYGDSLFAQLRQEQESFVLNDPTVRNRSVLVSGRNFGCGSSREHAVWALREWGFRAIIAESFADIFKSNGAKNGLILVSLSEEEVDSLLALPDEVAVTVDLEHRRVFTSTGLSLGFSYDPFHRHCILNGVDEFEYLLTRRERIRKFFEASPVQRFQLHSPTGETL